MRPLPKLFRVCGARAVEEFSLPAMPAKRSSTACRSCTTGGDRRRRCRHQTSLNRILSFFFVIFFSSSAYADTSFLLGGQLGGSVRVNDAERWSPRFRLGVGLDALTSFGSLFSLRVDARHDLETRAHLGAGYAATGFSEDHGLPLAITVGPALSLDREGTARFGPSAVLSWSLWYARATVEVQFDVTRALGREPPTLDRPPWAATLGLALRIVPFAPWRN